MTTKIENTATLRTENTEAKHFARPVAPANVGELSDEELAKLAGGVGIGMSNAGTFAIPT
jgi:mersacidin/lichenicidin family type 2 lantibiotic